MMSENDEEIGDDWAAAMNEQAELQIGAMH